MKTFIFLPGDRGLYLPSILAMCTASQITIISSEPTFSEKLKQVMEILVWNKEGNPFYVVWKSIMIM